MKTLYLDCFSGVSGDMMLGALIDLGADKEAIEAQLKALPIDPFTIEVKKVVKKGVSAIKLDVLLDSEHPPKKHRHYTHIIEMIDKSELSPRVKETGKLIFDKIGVAEGKIHNIPLEKVHFHEVGAVDSIVDVLGVCIALEQLGVEKIISRPVPVGGGSVKCDHGIYPVPAPATLEMLIGIPIAESPYNIELTTPTGAGIISALVKSFQPALPPFVVSQIGYGAGTKDLPHHPNVLRLVLGELR
jgi:uncharacterized protein (TIGR00299 family) protein